jgi:hypothetical protein
MAKGDASNMVSGAGFNPNMGMGPGNMGGGFGLPGTNHNDLPIMSQGGGKGPMMGMGQGNAMQNMGQAMGSFGSQMRSDVPDANGRYTGFAGTGPGSMGIMSGPMQGGIGPSNPYAMLMRMMMPQMSPMFNFMHMRPPMGGWMNRPMVPGSPTFGQPLPQAQQPSQPAGNDQQPSYSGNKQV